MTTPVIPVPSPFRLASCYVGQPVSSSHLARLSDESAFLAGAVVNTICSCEIRQRHAFYTQLSALDPKVYPVVHFRGPAANVVKITIELHPGTGQRSTVTTTLPTGATWIKANGLDGSYALQHPPSGFAEVPSFEAWVDVSGCARNTALYFMLSAAQTTGTPDGLSRVTLSEVPLAVIDPGSPQDEAALDGAWTVAGNRLVDGEEDGSTSFGLARIVFILDQLRKNHRRCFQLVGVEATDTTTLAACGLWKNPGGPTTQQIDFALSSLSGGDSEGWFVQCANLYAGEDETWNVVVRYRTDTATGGSFRVTTMDAAGGSATTTAITLAGTSGAWAWATGTVTMPVGFTNSEVRLKFDCVNNQATTDDLILFANITLCAAPA